MNSLKTTVFTKTRLAKAMRSAMMIAVPIFALTACDGDDGAQGPSGAAGAQGPAGQDGTQGAAGQDGVDGQDGADGQDGNTTVSMPAGLTRFATVPSGAEVTGMFLSPNGDLFFNAQHPDAANSVEDADGIVHNDAIVGVVTGVNLNSLPKNTISSPVPLTDEEKQTVQVAYGEYQVLLKGGDDFASAPAEGIGSVYDASGTFEVVRADMVDFNAYVPMNETTGYLFTNWEYFPGGMSRALISKAPGDVRWTVTDAEMLDFGAYGTIANCFGTLSPWNTPLTSEEWGNFGDNTEAWNAPDADVDTSSRDALATYINGAETTASEADVYPNTYRYHYIVEITNPLDGDVANVVPVKHYAMGRFEHENSVVMPDQRTVYLSQDSTNGVFYKFIADTAGDLSAGTLYAAKITQDAGSSEPATTGFDITWIELASGNNTQIETWIAEYDSIGTADYVAGRSSYITDADAIAWANGDAAYPSADTASADAVAAGYETTDADTYGGAVTAGEPMDDRVAFLESRKAARAKGATAEWRKFEGINVNVMRAEEAETGTDVNGDGEIVSEAYVYFAIADIDRGMIDDEGDIQLSDRVKDCGGVYRMPLTAGYDVARIEPVLMGATYRSSLDGAERCDVNNLSQPDNVMVMDDGRILLGEDGSQTNNTLWMYDPKAAE
ncbi:alkaline phosphatase PhoX [Agaribacter marinus]|uniref:Cell surface protein n=1 Tax=Agaribacter marinus TaxID=1431249 RepID=A0AA37SWK6_9ALTE|nr:alkaline phosphatase PhoX [Agaribacter marinus]GLR69480.1 hypothetical protein GCM10007852_03880 [Agaribacter marinus]